jgi:molybdopterin synthase sulfur carrier subunit
VTVRVILATHLKTLAHLDGEVAVEVPPPVTQRAVLDALEERYPALRNTVRDPATGRRRPLVRFMAAGEDLSHEGPDAPLPPGVAAGAEPFVILGAIAGG